MSQYRIEIFGNVASVYEYSEEHNAYLFWRKFIARTEKQVLKQIQASYQF